MPLLNSCCCWWEYPDSLKRGSYAASIYTAVIGGLQLILSGYAIYLVIWLQYSPDPLQKWQDTEIAFYFPPGSIILLYLTFPILIGKLCVGIFLWVGIERGRYMASKNNILAWLITNLCIEVFVIIGTIYICGYLQWYRLYDIYFMNWGMVLGVIWGFIDTGIMVWSLVCVFSFFQMLEEYEYGTLRRTRRALWFFDLGQSIRGSTSGASSRAPSTAYSFESLVDTKRGYGYSDRDYDTAHQQQPPQKRAGGASAASTLQGYGVSSSTV